MEFETPPHLREQIQGLPTSPGVYLMKDKDGTVLYVGKAKSLRQRVRSYFNKSGDARYSLRFLLPKVHQVESLLTDTEKEALILENNLIKKFKPRHNFNLKDDKTYFSLRVDPREEFPKVSLVRKVRNDKARYFGPYASSAAVKETLKLLHQTFPLRTCRDANFRNRSRPCLNHQIKKCLGPCCRLVTPEKYGELVQEVLLFLEGKNSQLIRLLREKMAASSAALDFEEAARVRDQILAMEKTLEKQKAVSHTEADLDVFAFHRQGNEWEFQILFFRRGLLLGNKSFHFPRLAAPDEEEALSAFVRQYYGNDRYIPHEILLPLAIEDEGLLSEWLSEKKGGKVEVASPRRGQKRHLIEMARKNAENSFQKTVSEEDLRALTRKELQEKLRLAKPPRSVECFDISNLFGTLAVGSMVRFLDATPDRSRYRHYKVLSPSSPDDYAMMYEVLQRRYGKPGDLEEPDLLIVDGGKGQLNVALAVLAETGRTAIAAIGLAKDRAAGLQKVGLTTADKVYLPNVKEPILLPAHSTALHFLQRVRDEAHRFAIAYHKKLRGKHGLQTILDEVPGVGEAKRQALFRSFGSLQKIREASVEDFSRTEPLTRRDAETLFAFFHPAEGGRKELETGASREEAPAEIKELGSGLSPYAEEKTL